jgi:hypothetical protein
VQPFGHWRGTDRDWATVVFQSILQKTAGYQATFNN